MPAPQGRREFLAVLGAASCAGPLGAAAGAGQEPEAQAAGSLHDPPRELSRSSADLGTNFAPLAQLAAARVFSAAWQPGQPYDEAFRAAARARVQQALSYAPRPVELAPEVVERVDCGDFVRERVLLSTAPWFRSAGYVLVPKKRSGRLPAVVDLHSHGGMFLFGKEKVIDLGGNHPVMTEYHQKNYDGRPTASELARRGFVVFSGDAFGFGERRLLLDEDHQFGWDRARYSAAAVALLNGKCRGKESTLAKSLALVGATWLGIVNYDDRRALDYLASRPEVDPERIGCCGISMGGYRALYLAALDERIRAAIVVGFMSSTPPMLQAHIDTHSWIHFLPGLHQALDLPDVSGLTAPRALFVQQCSQDRLFPLAGMQESVARIGQLYRAAGAERAFRGQFYDEPHRWTRAMQDEAFAWLTERLRGG